jgi:hypothetical protein
MLVATLMAISCNESPINKGTNDLPSFASTDSADSDSDNILITKINKTDSLNDRQVDSLNFRIQHHYSENFNFRILADSLKLTPRSGDTSMDTCIVYYGNLVVVAQIASMPNDTIDSVWVKVAHDQGTMGWIREKELLSNAIPNDTISQLLYVLSSSRILWMSAIVAMGIIAFFIRKARMKKLLLIKFQEIDTVYTPLFLILISVLACIYASIQNFVPWYWQEFYYHPSLNPFSLPQPLSSLVVVMWTMIVVFLALIDDIRHKTTTFNGIVYIIEIIGTAMIVYLVSSWSTIFYIGYLIVPAFVAFCIIFYFKKIRCKYTCGKCGKKIREKGKCPHCGTINE